MKKHLHLICAIAVVFLTSCSLTLSPKGAMKNSVFSDTTPSTGQPIEYGYKQPDSSWKCILVAQNSYDWSMERAKGMLDKGGGYEHLKNQALQYVDQNNIKANYFYINIPTDVALDGIADISDIVGKNKAQISYYHCSNLPTNTAGDPYKKSFLGM